MFKRTHLKFAIYSKFYHFMQNKRLDLKKTCKCNFVAVYRIMNCDFYWRKANTRELMNNRGKKCHKIKSRKKRKNAKLRRKEIK